MNETNCLKKIEMDLYLKYLKKKCLPTKRDPKNKRLSIGLLDEGLVTSQ